MNTVNSIHFVFTEQATSSAALCKKVEDTEEGYVCICSASIFDNIDRQMISNRMKEVDILHSGLSFHGGVPFSRVQLCTFNWFFLTPPSSLISHCWKASTDFVVFEKALFRSMGGFDTSYLSKEAMIMDFAFSILRQGGYIMNLPVLASQDGAQKLQSLPIEDESRFVLKHLNRSAFLFYRFSLLFLDRLWAKEPKAGNLHLLDSKNYTLKLTSATRQIQSYSPYSAIIPTINRYDYIERSIDSLLALSNPPAEIVVVDQSPPDSRVKGVYTKYNGDIVRIIFLDKPGQSTARNVGVEQARHPWILLFEDDAEAWPDMVQEHWNLLSSSFGDVSSGVVVPPGSNREFILKENRKYFISDIFTTGNAFLRKSTIESVGGFDKAFDKGSGADDDFGKRLYLSGKLILYNYKSIETHHKAPKGGMRVHGAWWRNKTTLFGAFPPSSQLYAIRKYYEHKYWPFLILSWLLKARKNHSVVEYVLLWLLFPYRLGKSWLEALNLERE